MFYVVVCQCALSGFKIYPEHALVFFYFVDLYQADLTCSVGMGAAACDAVRGIFDGANAYDRNILVEGKCFSERHFFGLFARIEAQHGHGCIGPDDSVRLELGPERILICDLGYFRFFFKRNIDGHVVMPHVKASVHSSEKAEEYP